MEINTKNDMAAQIMCSKKCTKAGREKFRSSLQRNAQHGEQYTKRKLSRILGHSWLSVVQTAALRRTCIITQALWIHGVFFELCFIREFQKCPKIEVGSGKEEEFTDLLVQNQTRVRQCQVHSRERQMPKAPICCRFYRLQKRFTKEYGSQSINEANNDEMVANPQLISHSNKSFPREFVLQSLSKQLLGKGARGSRQSKVHMHIKTRRLG